MGLGADAETMAALAASGGAVGNSLGCRARLQSARALDARINEDKEAAAADEAVPATAEETTTATSLSTPATPPSSPAVSSSTLQALGLVGLAEPEPEPELTESCSVVGVLSSSLCAAAGGIGGGGGGGGLGSVAVAKALLTAATTKQKRKKKRRKRNVVSRLYQTPPAAGGAGAGAPTTPTPSAKPRAAGIIKSKLMGGVPSLASSGGSAVGLPSVTGGGNSHPTLATVVKAAQKKYTGADTCRDLRGKRYDIKEFRERRNRAVLKGMKYMKKYLLKNNCAALFDIGDDAPSIFFEIWYTSANSDIRVRGKETARVLLDKLITQRLARVGDDVPSRDDFFEYIFLIRCVHEMEIEYAPLLAKADEAWKENGFADTDELFGYGGEELHEVKTSEWLMLLMRILMMEYMNVVCLPRRWRMRWGLQEALCEGHTPP